MPRVCLYCSSAVFILFISKTKFPPLFDHLIDGGVGLSPKSPPSAKTNDNYRDGAIMLTNTISRGTCRVSHKSLVETRKPSDTNSEPIATIFQTARTIFSQTELQIPHAAHSRGGGGIEAQNLKNAMNHFSRWLQFNRPN